MIATLDSLAREYAAAHQTRDGFTWHLWCGSLMWRMCDRYGVAPSPVPATAQAAGTAAGKLNTDFSVAPKAAFHYWTFGKDGHVGLDTTGGGVNVFMASKYLRESLGDAIGFQSVEGYTRAGTCTYRGWSLNYGKNGRVYLPKLPLGLQSCVDKGIIDPNGDLNREVNIETLAWALHKTLIWLGKA